MVDVSTNRLNAKRPHGRDALMGGDPEIFGTGSIRSPGVRGALFKVTATVKRLRHSLYVYGISGDFAWPA